MLTLCLITKNIKESLIEVEKIMLTNINNIIIINYGDIANDIMPPKNIKIYNMALNNNFSSLWNRAFSEVSSKYVMWLFENEIVTDSLTNFLSSDTLLTLLNKSVDVVTFNISSYYDNKNTNNNDEVRIMKMALCPHWKGRVNPRIHIDECNTLEKSNCEIFYTSSKSDDSEMIYNIFNSMYDDGEVFSKKDIIDYGYILMKKHEYDRALTVYEKLISANDSTSPDAFQYEKHLAIFNSSWILFNIKNRKQDAKKLLSLGMAMTQVPEPHYCVLMGDMYNDIAAQEWAKKWYEMALSCAQFNNAKTLEYIDYEYIALYPISKLKKY